MTTLWQAQRYITAIVILLAFLAVVVRILRSSVHEGVIYSKVPQNDVDTVDGNSKGEGASGWEEWEDPSAVLDVPSPIGSMQTKPEETFSRSQGSNAGKKTPPALPRGGSERQSHISKPSMASTAGVSQSSFDYELQSILEEGTRTASSTRRVEGAGSGKARDSSRSSSVSASSSQKNRPKPAATPDPDDVDIFEVFEPFVFTCSDATYDLSVVLLNLNSLLEFEPLQSFKNPLFFEKECRALVIRRRVQRLSPRLGLFRHQ